MEQLLRDDFNEFREKQKGKARLKAKARAEKRTLRVEAKTARAAEELRIKEIESGVITGRVLAATAKDSRELIHTHDFKFSPAVKETLHRIVNKIVAFAEPLDGNTIPVETAVRLNSIVSDTLPASLNAFTSLPEEYRGQGSNAETLLLDQSQMLEDLVDDAIGSIAANQLELLKVQQLLITDKHRTALGSNSLSFKKPRR